MEGDDMAEEKIYYCVGCGRVHHKNNFYMSQNKFHANGMLPYCKKVIKDYSYKGDNKVDVKSFQSILMQMNVPFLNDTYESAMKSKGDTIGHYFRMFNSLPQNEGKSWEDSEFEDKKYEGVNVEDQEDGDIIFYDESGNIKPKKEIEIFWGRGFEQEDYLFLEIEMRNWKKTHKCDNQAETTLLKEICIKILEIRRAREQSKSVSKQQKELQDLMKTASVDPAKANVADSGKALDAYGLWIKDIEREEPAEYFADKELFKDFDGIKKYVDNYIYRPLRNLLTGSRDFDIERGDN